MAVFYRYRGCRYRVAAQLRQAQEPADTAEEPPAAGTDESGGTPLLQAVRQRSAEILAEYEIQSPIELQDKFKQEADGIDAVYNVGDRWSGVTALLTLDFNSKAKLQEVVLELCGQLYVAHSGSEQKELLSALGTLHAADFKPELAQDVVQDKQKQQYLEFLEYWVNEMMKAAMQLPGIGEDYGDRAGFIKAMEQYAKTDENQAPGPIPPERAKNLMDGARLLSDDEWAKLIKELEEGGTAYGTKQELVNKAVLALTAHEDYNGEAQIVGSTPEGKILAGIQVPLPIQSMTFVLDHQPGQKQLQLSQAGLGICDAIFLALDEALTKRLVTALVDLVKASNVKTDEQLSKPPELDVEPEWTPEKLKKAFTKAVTVWKSDNGYRLMVGNNNMGCFSEAEWTHPSGESGAQLTLRNMLQQAAAKKLRVFQIDEEGRVDSMNYEFKPTKTNIARFDENLQQFECPVTS